MANHGVHEVENEGMVRSYRKIDIFKQGFHEPHSVEETIVVGKVKIPFYTLFFELMFRVEKGEQNEIATFSTTTDCRGASKPF